MTAARGRAVIGALLVCGVVCLLLPGGAWERLATLGSSDGTISDPGFQALVRSMGRLLAAACAILAAACWRWRWVRGAGRWVTTCVARDWLLLLAVAVVVPRLLWMFTTFTTPHVDLAWYDGHARNLAAGLGYVENGKPTAFWPIGYPAFLALLYRFAGMHIRVVHAVHVLLAYLTTIGVWTVGRRPLGEGRARIAALVYALCPSTVMFTELLSTETLFSALLVAVWCLLLSRDMEPWRRRMSLGLLVGLGVLVKPVLLPWPALAVVLLARPGTRGRAAYDALVVYVVAAVVIAPWTYRNWQAFGRFVLVSTNTGFNLYVGNAPGATGAVRVLPPAEWDPYYAMDDEAERDVAMRRAAAEAMRAEPGRILRLLPAKWAALLGNDQAALRWAGGAPGADWSAVRAFLTRITLDGYYYACWALALLGIVRRGDRAPAGDRASPWPALWSWAAYLVVVHGVFYGDPRYHQALWPLLALAAARGLRTARVRA